MYVLFLCVRLCSTTLKRGYIPVDRSGHYFYQLMVPAVIMACLAHGDFNRSFFFDTVWFSSLNLETVALVPQLWMMSKIGGKVSTVSAQFIAANVASKVMTVTFWIWAYPELVDENGSNLAGQLIIGAYMIQLLLAADFMFYYVKGLLEGTDQVVLPQAEGIEM